MSATLAAIGAVLLLCAGMTALLVIYFVVLWCFVFHSRMAREEEKPGPAEGLSASELEKLPKVAGKDMVLTGKDCAVCLEEIQGEEVARVPSACNHGFHLECADVWLSRHSVCPLCRAQIRPDIHCVPENLC